LTHLTFGRDFNQPIEHALIHLHHLTHLKFDWSFKQELKVLPKSLKFLNGKAFSWIKPQWTQIKRE